MYSLVPKFNRDEKFNTRAFYNWATLKEIIDWSDNTDEEEEKS